MSEADENPAPVRKLDVLIGDAYEVLPFSQLELPAKLAVAHYLAFDGGIWSDLVPAMPRHPSAKLVRQTLADCTPRFEARFGQLLFGVASLPRAVVLDVIMKELDCGHGPDDWKAYQDWYATQEPIPRHKPTDRWPVVLSSRDDESLVDGWHRLHCYLRRGDETVPAVFYPSAHHRERARG